MKKCFFLILISSWCYAGFSTVFNPFSGKQDYVGFTTVSTGTVSNLTVSTITFNGSGNASITEPNGVSGQIVLSTNTPNSGLCAQWSSSMTLVSASAACGSGGTPASPGNSVQYNNSGSFGGSSNFQFNGTSVTVVSSFTINSGGGSPADNVTPGFFNVFVGADSYPGRVLFDAGSQGQRDQFYVSDRQPVNMSAFGSQVGNLFIGTTAGPTQRRLLSTGRSNYFEVDNISTMTFNTDNDIAGGDMVFQPQNTEVFRISKITSLRGLSPTNTTYEITLGTTTSAQNIAISTNGFVTSFGPTPTVSSCGSSPNGSVVGDDSAGVITVGGSAPTACTLTFAVNHVGCNMVCTITDNSLTISDDISSLTTSALTLGFGVGGLAGGTVYYQCHGYGLNCK